MPGLGPNGTIGALVTAISAFRTDIHQRYAAWLYRQAMWSLGGPALAEQAVRDVIADESALAARRGAVGRRPGMVRPPACPAASSVAVVGDRGQLRGPAAGRE
jgi:hypothetical protein